MNTIWKNLTISGVILLAYSFIMDTTVETSVGSVHNIGLLNRQSSFLMLGGILLIAGLILRSSNKSTQRTEAEEDEERASQERLSVGGGSLPEVVGRRGSDGPHRFGLPLVHAEDGKRCIGVGSRIHDDMLSASNHEKHDR